MTTFGYSADLLEPLVKGGVKVIDESCGGYLMLYS